MTNSINIQKMLQADTSSIKKQDNTSAKSDAGEEFKNLVAKKTDVTDRKEEVKTPDSKPEEEDSEKKDKEELKPGESVPLTDLLFSRPETLTDAEKAVAMVQFPVKDPELTEGNMPVQGIGDALKEMAGMNQGSDAVTEIPLAKLEPAGQATILEAPANQISAVQQTLTEISAAEVPTAQQPAIESKVIDMYADSSAEMRNRISQAADSSVGKKTQNVDKQPAAEIIVDKLPLTEEKTAEMQVTDTVKEELPEGTGKDLKDLPQFSTEEKTDKEGKTENLLNSDFLKPEAFQKEIVEIKVAEPYDRLNTETVKNLADKLTENIVNGKKEFTIQLTPEMLGKIAVKISMADDGIKVTLSCERQKTCQLLAEQASGINRIVEHNTGQTAVVEVKEGYWNQQKNATDQHSRQNQNQEQNHQERASKAETDDFIQQLRLGFFDNRISV